MAFWQTVTKQSDEIDRFSVDLASNWLDSGEALSTISVDQVLEFKNVEATQFPASGEWTDSTRPDELRVIPITDGEEGDATDIPVASIYDEALLTLIDTDSGTDASGSVPVQIIGSGNGKFTFEVGKGGTSGKDYVISFRWTSDAGREEVTHMKLSIRDQLSP